MPPEQVPWKSPGFIDVYYMLEFFAQNEINQTIDFVLDKIFELVILRKKSSYILISCLVVFQAILDHGY